MDKLVGSKYVAVKTLMEYPDVCRDEVMKLVSEHGWDGPLVKHHSKPFPFAQNTLNPKYLNVSLVHVK